MLIGAEGASPETADEAVTKEVKLDVSNAFNNDSANGSANSGSLLSEGILNLAQEEVAEDTITFDKDSGFKQYIWRVTDVELAEQLVVTVHGLMFVITEREKYTKLVNAVDLLMPELAE